MTKEKKCKHKWILGEADIDVLSLFCEKCAKVKNVDRFTKEGEWKR